MSEMSEAKFEPGNMIFRVLAGESSLRPRVGADT